MYKIFVRKEWPLVYYMLFSHICLFLNFRKVSRDQELPFMIICKYQELPFMIICKCHAFSHTKKFGCVCKWDDYSSLIDCDYTKQESSASLILTSCDLSVRTGPFSKTYEINLTE